MTRKLYYPAPYADEVVPCDCTLKGWAAWLAEPDEEWGRSKAAQDGEEFEATSIELFDDLVACFSGEAWLTPRPPAEATAFAIRWASDAGWDAESIESTVEAMHARADERDMFPPRKGDHRFVACWKDGPTVRLRFEDDGSGARLVVLGPVN